MTVREIQLNKLVLSPNNMRQGDVDTADLVADIDGGKSHRQSQRVGGALPAPREIALREHLGGLAAEGSWHIDPKQRLAAREPRTLLAPGKVAFGIEKTQRHLGRRRTALSQHDRRVRFPDIPERRIDQMRRLSLADDPAALGMTEILVECLDERRKRLVMIIAGGAMTALEQRPVSLAMDQVDTVEPADRIERGK